MRRSYGQYCGLARALDLVGDRWTLLIVRDLAVGAKRFTDLLAGLPGLGTSLLSERLQHLEQLELVRRVTRPRPESGTVYELTDRGRELAVAVAPLARWGGEFLERTAGEGPRPEWLRFMLEASFDPHAAQDVRDCYELRVNGVVLWAVVEDGTVEVVEERPCAPDFSVTCDAPTLAALGAGHLTPADAVLTGRAQMDGDAEAGRRMLRIFGSA